MKIHIAKFRKGGYTLLFAVLTAALVLGVAVFILSVSTKQYELSASARNSVYSFYAADAGIECVAAAYSGYNGGTVTFDTDTPSNPPKGATVNCGPIPGGTTPQVVTVGVFTLASSGYPPFLVGNVYKSDPMNFLFPISGNTQTCAVVTMYDGYDASPSPGPYHYMIFNSRGYNHCTSTGAPDTSNPTTVERALQLTKKG